MSLAELSRSDAHVERCLDELNDFFLGLEHYTPTALAVAMRVHLEALLQGLLSSQYCTREEVRDFVRELEREALQYQDA